MSLKILATADLHLGRRPSKLFDSHSAERCSCARIWQAIVDGAIAEQVDLVLLAGDIVDQENRFFEATGPLERGLRRLGEHQITTYAVAGNHDFDVLGQIADVIDAGCFQVLGLRGQWKEVTWTGSGGRQLKIRGWSFPDRHMLTSPLASYSFSPGGEIPTLSLVHADLDVPDSQYAPVARAELLAHEVSIWVLGHVHRPCYEPCEVGPPLLYPGSPQPLDPSETGVHGPWLIEIHGPRHVTATQMPVATVRYDHRDVDLTDVETEAEFKHRTWEHVSDGFAQAVRTSKSLQEYWVRLELIGRTGLCRWVDREGASQLAELEQHVGDAVARVEKAINNTLPPVHLDELAQKHDPPGVLARMLLQLQSDQLDEQLNQLLEDATESMLQVHESSAYVRIASDLHPDREAARRCLLRQGWQLLETLRSQERTS